MSDAEAAERKEEMMEKVYSMYWKGKGEPSPEIKPLDGDFDKVFPSGYGFTQEKQDALSSAIRLEDRTYVNKISTYQGVPVDLTYMPTKAEFISNGYDLEDVMYSRSRFVVSNKFREVIEKLEPAKHQFSAVELVDEAGAHVAEYFWFNPCARIDSMDREHTTHELYKEREWDYKPDGKFVANISHIAESCIWIDPLTAFQTVFVTQKTKDALHTAGLQGVNFGELEAVRGGGNHGI